MFWKYITVPMQNVLFEEIDCHGAICNYRWKKEFLDWCIDNNLINVKEATEKPNLYNNKGFCCYNNKGFCCTSPDNGIGQACFAFGRQLLENTDLHVLFKATWG